MVHLSEEVRNWNFDFLWGSEEKDWRRGYESYRHKETSVGDAVSAYTAESINL